MPEAPRRLRARLGKMSPTHPNLRFREQRQFSNIRQHLNTAPSRFPNSCSLLILEINYLTPHIRSFKMGDADITASNWRLTEVGRVVLVNQGEYSGRLATIVEIIDHKRVCTN